MKSSTKTYLILLIIIFGCERKLSLSEFERKAFDQVFIEVVDSTYRDKRLYTLFPEKDDLGKVQFQSERDSLQKDTTDLIIAILSKGVLNDSTDLTKYNTSKFNFKKFLELPVVPEMENWSKKYPKFAGVMSFSDIRFNKDYSVGELDVSYSCGGKCGLGFTVTIHRIKNIWRVKKVKQTWIA